MKGYDEYGLMPGGKVSQIPIQLAVGFDVGATAVFATRALFGGPESLSASTSMIEGNTSLDRCPGTVVFPLSSVPKVSLTICVIAQLPQRVRMVTGAHSFPIASINTETFPSIKPPFKPFSAMRYSRYSQKPLIPLGPCQMID